MIIPKYNGRIMKEVKKCFTYEELQRQDEKPKKKGEVI